MGSLKDSLDLALNQRQAQLDLQRSKQEQQKQEEDRRKQEEPVARYNAHIKPYVDYLQELGIPETVTDLAEVITQQKDKPLVKQIARIKHPKKLHPLTGEPFTESYTEWSNHPTAQTITEPEIIIQSLGYSVYWGRRTYRDPKADEYVVGASDYWVYHADLLARRNPETQNFELLVQTSKDFRTPIINESVCKDLVSVQRVVGDFYLSTVQPVIK